MSILSVIKKPRSIVLGVFALLGLGLAIGLIVTGLFAPFGTTLVALFGAGALLFLASLGVAVLFIIAARAITGVLNYFSSGTASTEVSPVPQPVADAPKEAAQASSASVSMASNTREDVLVTDSEGKDNLGQNSVQPSSTPAPVPVPVPESTSQAATTEPSSSASTLSNPLFSSPPAPPPSKEQSKKDAESVRQHIVKLFQPNEEFHDGSLMAEKRGAKSFHVALKNGVEENYFYIKEIPDTNDHKIILSCHEAFWSATKPKVDTKTNKLICPIKQVSYFVQRVNQKWGDDTAISFSNNLSNGTYFYWAEISPEKIKEILPKIESKPALEKKL